MRVASQRLTAAAFCLAALSFSTACGSGAAAGREAATGAELYQACESCHGPDGAGIEAQQAPSIAGLPEWYVASQLERFQTGLRGKHPDDVEGLKMRPMSLQVNSATQRQAVAAYVSSLAPVRSAARLSDADATVGEQTYAMCIACHGPKGEGNQAVNAPPLAGLDDWYVALQIRKFRSGIRGAVPGDTVGPVMAAMSMAIQPDVIDDVAAYVHALPR
jgi:cytochrome c oxidase subunit 2